jgi:hypothetical protein
LLILLASCSKPSDEIDIMTIKWQPDGQGYIQFYTNDEQYYGYFFIHVPSGAYESTMSAVEVDAKKISGSSEAGFGVIFCGTDIDNFYKLLISLYGNYRVTKIVSGTQTEIIPWSSSGGTLNANHGVINKIRVQFDGTDTFSIYFNGAFVNSFVDTSFSGGDAGYYVYVSSTYESFPDTPTDIRFKMIHPVEEP